MEKDQFDKAFIVIINDKRITVWHISIYVALFIKWTANAFNNPVFITRREIMKLAHIGSIATYHKCIKDLKQFGYIEYFPSYNPAQGSEVNL